MIRLIGFAVLFQCRKPCEEIRLRVLRGTRCYIQPCRIETTRAPEIFDGLGLGETGKPRGFKESGNLIGALDLCLELGRHGDRQ